MVSTETAASENGAWPRRAPRALQGAGRLAGFANDALQIMGLCGMAILQPLLSTLGPNPTYFVAHDLTGNRILVFVAVIMLAPATALSVVVLTARLLAPRAALRVSAVVKGILAAAAVVSLAGLASRLPTLLYLGAAALLVAALSVAFHSRPEMRTFALALSPMTPVFAGLFLFTSASGELVTASDPAAVVTSTGSGTSVYMLIFDELPTAALITPGGDIDRDRFPGFARLADLSTWYRQATTVDSQSVYAVPAIMSGELVTDARAPVAGQYPRSIFTMLGGSRAMTVREEITQLCPRSLCHEGARAAASTRKDTAILIGYPLLPQSVARDRFPGVGNQWADFDTFDLPTESRDLAVGDFVEEAAPDWNFGPSTVPIYDDFLARLAAEADPTLGLLHLLFPHAPFNFLPDGTRYPGRIPGLIEQADWVDDEDVVAVAMQRFMLQTTYADRLVDSFLDTLAGAGRLNDAMVIVVADHGIVFEPGMNRRTPFADGVWPVPLFVKYPGRAGGEVDDRLASTVDIMPTIADQLDLSLPDDWTFDGESFMRPSTRDRTPVLEFRYPDFEPAAVEQLDPVAGQARYQEWLGSHSAEHDLYRLGPHGSLVGVVVNDGATPLEGAFAQAAALDALAAASPDDEVIPALVDVGVAGVPDDAWLAVTINDTVAGVGPVYAGDGGLRLTAMVDPSLLSSGGNDIELYLIDDNRLRPIELTS